MRLIDAVELVRDIDIAFKGIKASEEEFERFRDLCGLIWLQPIVDPVKHGRWIKIKEDYDIDDPLVGRCSVCGWFAGINDANVLGMNYCPNCGADMRGENDG